MLFAHIFSLYPPSSAEVKKYLITLLKIISSSPSERLSVKYRMCVVLFFLCSLCQDSISYYFVPVFQISSTPYLGTPHCVSLYIKPFFKLPPLKMNSMSSNSQNLMSRNGSQNGRYPRKKKPHSSSRLSMPISRLNNRELPKCITVNTEN